MNYRTIRNTGYALGIAGLSLFGAGIYDANQSRAVNEILSGTATMIVGSSLTELSRRWTSPAYIANIAKHGLNK